MTTQATFLSKARVRLDEATARQWTDQNLREWINEGARDIARKTETLEDRDTIAAVVGTGEYAISTDVVRVHRVEFTPTSEDTVRLEYADLKDLDSFGWRQRTMQQDRPYVYTIWGAGPALKLIVFPVPGTAGNFTVYVYRLPAALAESSSADANTAVEIPQGYDDILLDYIEYRAMRKDRDPRWVEAKAMYDENLAQMYDNTRRWTDQPGMILPSDNGALPAWLVEGF